MGTLDVGSVIGKGKELTDVTKRKKMDIWCEQENEGSKARNIAGSFELIYHGVNERRNEVGIILNGQLVKHMHEEKRKSDKLVNITIEVGGELQNILVLALH